MKEKRQIAFFLAVFTMLCIFGTVATIAGAQKVDKSQPKKERSISLGEKDVKDLLTLMDTDKSGKISKQEFLKFMEAEFDRLDADKSGELDVKELTKSQVRVSPGAVGK
jgi:Ca2+-binding EF-hand superfamily protein